MKFRPVRRKGCNWVWEIRCEDRVVILTRAQGLLFSLLCARPGVLVDRATFEDALWAEREDGGPTDMVGALDKVIASIRRRLAESVVPYTIEAQCGRGFRLVEVHEAVTRYQSRWVQMHKEALLVAAEL